MNRKQKFKYFRRFIREKKINQPFMKRGIYGALFDLPKKVEKALREAKNNEHREYMEKIFQKIAKKAKSKNVLKKIWNIQY